MTAEKDDPGNGSGSTSPTLQSMFVSPIDCCFFWASSIMAGVMSMPVTCRATPATAQVMRPGPQATSSTVSSGPIPAVSITSRLVSSSLWCGISRKRHRLLRELFHDQPSLFVLSVGHVTKAPQSLERQPDEPVSVQPLQWA